MDFIFGTYSNDALKLANYRAIRNGIQHQHNIRPLDPAPGEMVTVSVVTSGESGITEVALYYTTDESTPQGTRGIAQHGNAVAFHRVKTVWDSTVWDYLHRWEVTIPPQPENTLVQYIISGWTPTGEEMYADWPNAHERVQHAAMIHFENIPADSIYAPSSPTKAHCFNYHVDTTRPPEWAQDAIIYQVFIDRFSPGDGQNWLQTDDLSGLWGGTLQGVCDKLDYLADLGINCIWLSPVWTSPSYHRYDVSNYREIDPRLGGDDALRDVVAGAHQRGMHVLLDMVCNHISNEHPIFLDAYHNPDSPYLDWFFFDKDAEHGYVGFFNVETMPELNLTNPEARDWMISHAVYWLQEFDVDGYRLDYANGPGPVFWTHFRRACKAAKPDCLIFGEIVEPSDMLRKYLGRLDGCLDFPMNSALRHTFAYQSWDSTRFEAFCQAHQAYFDANFVMPSFIDNHDMDRFSFIARNDPERLKQAIAMQFQLPQPPVIFGGSEVGLKQLLSTREHRLDVCRPPMPWGEEDHELLAFYKQQIQARKAQLHTDEMTG